MEKLPEIQIGRFFWGSKGVIIYGLVASSASSAEEAGNGENGGMVASSCNGNGKIPPPPPPTEGHPELASPRRTRRSSSAFALTSGRSTYSFASFFNASSRSGLPVQGGGGERGGSCTGGGRRRGAGGLGLGLFVHCLESFTADTPLPWNHRTQNSDVVCFTIKSEVSNPSRPVQRLGCACTLHCACSSPHLVSSMSNDQGLRQRCHFSLFGALFPACRAHSRE